MAIEDDIELIRFGLVQHPIDPFEELGIDGVWGIFRGMCGPFNGNADTLESGIPDVLEILRFEFQPPIALFWSFKSIAEIHPTTECLVDGEDIGLFALRLLSGHRGNETNNEHWGEVAHRSHQRGQ